MDVLALLKRCYMLRIVMHELFRFDDRDLHVDVGLASEVCGSKHKGHFAFDKGQSHLQLKDHNAKMFAERLDIDVVVPSVYGGIALGELVFYAAIEGRGSLIVHSRFRRDHDKQIHGKDARKWFCTYASLLPYLTAYHESYKNATECNRRAQKKVQTGERFYLTECLTRYIWDVEKFILRPRSRK